MATTFVKQAAEAKLRTWGAHWSARLDGCAKENLSVEPMRVQEEGDNEKATLALKLLHPRLTPEEALEAIKYGPTRRHVPVSYGLPDMAQLDMEVSLACRTVAETLYGAYKCQNGANPEAPLLFKKQMTVCQVGDDVFGQVLTRRENVRLTGHQGAVFSRLAVRFLVREVYVLGVGLRSKWRGSSFDFLYPYALEPKDRRGQSGREATLNMVKRELG